MEESGRLPTDEELIARTLAGEDEAFAELVSRHKDLVYTIALRVVGDEDEADDVAQEAFVRAYRALGRFRGDSKFSSWVYRIAVNRGLTHLKRRKRRAVTIDFVAEPHIEAPAAMADKSTDPEQFVLDQEFRLRVREAVNALPPRYRAVVTLFYLEERSYKEVAEVLGIPMGTLKTHLHRARALLKNILADNRND